MGEVDDPLANPKYLMLVIIIIQGSNQIKTIGLCSCGFSLFLFCFEVTIDIWAAGWFIGKVVHIHLER